jgi:hypothetical protein
MNDEVLIATLEEQSEHARQCLAYYARLEETGMILQRPKPDIAEITSAVTAVLTKHPVFGPGRNIFFATKPLNLHPHFAPQGLFEVMLRSDARSAVAWLHRLFQIDRAELRMIAAIHGVEVQRPVDLANGVSLLPIAAAPDSPNLRMLARRYQVNHFAMMDIASTMPPAIAVLNMGTIAGSADLEAGKQIHENAYASLLDAARALTLSDRGAAVVGNSWTDFVDTSLTSAEFGRMWMSARFEGSPSQMLPEKIDGNVLAWATRYLRLEKQRRRSIDVALDRLNVARRRRTPGDQAIDSGICLEALLGDENSQELTYKLQLRAALLLGTSLPERQEIRKAVRDLYALRSKVVHAAHAGPRMRQRIHNVHLAVFRFALKPYVKSFYLMPHQILQRGR